MSQCRYPSVVGRNTWYCILDKAEHAGKPHHYGYEDAPQPAPAASGDEELRLLRELEAVVRDHTECRCETMERALGGLDAARRNDRAR